MSERLDVLNRDVFVENLVQLVNCLSDKEQGRCFGLDGAWGSGKSFVLDKFEEKLKCIQSEKTKTDTYFVFHYDCNAIQLSIISVVFCHRAPLFFMPKYFKYIRKTS